MKRGKLVNIVVTATFGLISAAIVAVMTQSIAAEEAEAPVAQVCEGEQCEHQPVGGSSSDTEPTPVLPSTLAATVALTDSRDRTIVSFRSLPSKSPTLYRIEHSTDLKQWVTAWEGAEQAGESGKFSVFFGNGGMTSGYFRVLALPGE